MLQLETLELSRQSIMIHSATVIQSCWRAHFAFTLFTLLKKSTITIQRAFRAHCDRQHFCSMKTAAIAIQRQWRTYCQYELFCTMRYAAVIIQRKWRAYCDRRNFAALRQAAITLQTIWRVRCDRQYFCAKRRAAGIIQFAWRVYKEQCSVRDRKWAAERWLKKNAKEEKHCISSAGKATAAAAVDVGSVGGWKAVHKANTLIHSQIYNRGGQFSYPQVISLSFLLISLP